jgi:EAL domain-containing protein (putative c-di-GMP-specific phosphodiesterase class I)
LDVVSAAEASGLIVELGGRVLQLAAVQAAQWRHDHGILVPVAVNVSAVQLTRSTFTADVLAALELAGVPSQALTLELTESVLLKSGSAGMDQLLVLRDHGVHLAIDDFGTGYASLVYLRDLPATTLKIDRSFVDGIPDDGGAMAIVAGVVGLARSFGMACIAEGIETDTQREYFAGHGVLGQGFLLARPSDGAAISRLIAQHGAQFAVATGDALSVPEARDAAGTRRDRAGGRARRGRGQAR